MRKGKNKCKLEVFMSSVLQFYEKGYDYENDAFRWLKL